MKEGISTSSAQDQTVARDERHAVPVQVKVRGSDSIDVDIHQLMGVLSA